MPRQVRDGSQVEGEVVGWGETREASGWDEAGGLVALMPEQQMRVDAAGTVPLRRQSAAVARVMYCCCVACMLVLERS